MATVRIPTPLRAFTRDLRIVNVEGGTLQEIVEGLESQFPGIQGRLVDGDGQVHAFVNIFVDGEDVRFLQGLATPLRERSEVSIIPAMAGGLLDPNP